MLAALAGRLRRWRDRRRIAASGAFDAAWYLRRYPDVAAAGIDPLRHYVESGCREGRFPNPIFDTAWYRAEYLSAAPRSNALVDYLEGGWRRGRRPNRWLDPAWYRARAGLAAAIDPMRHYLAAGRDAPPPGPDLDPAALARDVPDLGGDGSPLGFVLNTYRVVGDLDACTSYYIAAWVGRRAGPKIVVTIAVNGAPVGTVTPWIARPDVKRALGFDGLGFCFVFPRRLAHGDVVALHDDLGQSLIGCTTTYEVPPLGTTTDFYLNRASIAAAFLKGRGVEIGAFSQPNDLPPDREITFYDRYPAQTLREVYDPDCGRPLMAPDYVGQAETLDGLPDAAFDFLIANHVIEHLQDPILFLQSIARKLVPGGRAMIAAPDKRYCMDKPRSLTPFEHLVDDHELGTAPRQRAHFVRYYVEAGGQEQAVAEANADHADMDDIRFHYHVWDAESFVAFVTATIARYALPLAVVYTRATEADIIVVLERTEPQATPEAAARPATRPENRQPPRNVPSSAR